MMDNNDGLSNLNICNDTVDYHNYKEIFKVLPDSGSL